VYWLPANRGARHAQVKVSTHCSHAARPDKGSDEQKSDVAYGSSTHKLPGEEMCSPPACPMQAVGSGSGNMSGVQTAAESASADIDFSGALTVIHFGTGS
jgi:hypothetical protein